MSPSSGQVLVDTLVSLGVERFYTVPGESFLEVLEGARVNPRARLISTRHESGAGFMAEADAKLTGRPAVAMATRAPGAANLAIGVHTAWHDSTPLIALLGQVEARLFGSGLAFQEIDLEAFYGPITKWTATLERPGDAAALARRAAEVATSGRPGPVMIALPGDVLGEAVPADLPPAPGTGIGDHSSPSDALPGPVAQHALERLRARLAHAERPVMIVGGRSAGQWEALVEFAERYGIGVYSAFRRQDHFPNDHPAYLGHLTLAPAPSLLAALRAADVVMAMGCRLSEVTTQGFTLPSPDAFFAHLDLDATTEHPGPGRAPDLAVVAEVGSCLRVLLAGHEPVRGDRSWSAGHRAYLEDSRLPLASQKPLLQPSEVVAAMCRCLPEESIVASDAGNFSLPLHRHWRFRRPFTQLAPTSGAMGYAVPAAVAASVVRPDTSVVAVVGDGGYLMTGQEVETAVREGAKLVVVVMRNGLYGTIAMHQARTFGELSGVAIGEVDLAAHAVSLGAQGFAVRDRASLEGALTEAVAAAGPAVVDVLVDPDAITPSSTLSGLQAATRARGR